MAKQVVTTAMMKCSMGVAPAMFTATPKMVKSGYQDAGNIMDHVPMVNIPTFGMCNAKTNPAVIAATAAASGTPTPAPCVPVTPAPWISGAPTVPLAFFPALNDTSCLMCTWLGKIEFTTPGQFTEDIP